MITEKRFAKRLFYVDGTSVELCLDSENRYGVPSTVYVAENGWRTTNRWSDNKLAIAMFECDVESAKKNGVFDRVEDGDWMIK